MHVAAPGLKSLTWRRLDALERQEEVDEADCGPNIELYALLNLWKGVKPAYPKFIVDLGVIDINLFEICRRPLSQLLS